MVRWARARSIASIHVSSHRSCGGDDHSSWLVWSGDDDWAITPELVERAWALYGIGLMIAPAEPMSLSVIGEHLRAARSVLIDFECVVTEYSELASATKLIHLDIRETPSEDVDLGALRRLEKYRGPTNGEWSSVFDLPYLSDVIAEDDVPAVINAPLEHLVLGAPTTRVLPALRRPQLLRTLASSQTREFDLQSLEAASGLESVDLASSNFVHLGSLLSLRWLRSVGLDGRSREDASALAGLEALDARISLGPKGGAPTALVDAAARKDWTIEASDAVMRAAYARLGRPYPYDDDAVETIVMGSVQIEIDRGYPGASVLLTDPSAIGDVQSGHEAGDMIVAAARREFGSATMAGIASDSEADLTVIRCPTEQVATQIAGLINKLVDASSEHAK